MNGSTQQQWATVSFRAMGCHWSLWLDAADEAVARHAFEVAVQLVHSAENALSRFRPMSELSLLNQRTNQWVAVSPALWTNLTASLAAARETRGLFDPTILSSLVAIGYEQSFDTFKHARHHPIAWGDGCWRDVKVDAATQSVWLPKGVQLDFGGMAKGVTAHSIVAYLSQFGAALVDAGGDIVAGDAPSDFPGWPTGIAAPHDGAQLARLWLRNAALMTSGVDYRRWQTDRGVRHHIVDPQRGDSAETDLLSVTILAASAQQAEAWATAALVAGLDSGYDLLVEHNIAAMLITSARQLHITPRLEPLLQFENTVIQEIS